MLKDETEKKLILIIFQSKKIVIKRIWIKYDWKKSEGGWNKKIILKTKTKQIKKNNDQI